MKITNFLLILLSFLFAPGLAAQVNTVATGGAATGSGGVVTYTIGQTDFTYIEDSIGSLNLGVQQPYEIYFLRINDPVEFGASILVYPNPANEVLYICAAEGDFSHYQILDAQGKLIDSSGLTDPYQSINIQNLAAGVYFIKVSYGNGTYRTQKFYKY